MVRTSLPLAVAFIALPLAACSRGGDSPGVAAPLPMPAASTVVRGTAPTPPDGAAAGLAIPARLAERTYATPNHGVPHFAAAWHLRVALNVAALNCGDPAIASAYNRVLRTHRRELDAAHRRVTAMHGGDFDRAMTRLYNYFAQPPVLPQFCSIASGMAQEAAGWPVSSLAEAAPDALARIDQPYHAFYARYDAYRVALIAWRSGVPAATPKLAYDGSALAGDTRVTGGSVTLAAR